MALNLRMMMVLDVMVKRIPLGFMRTFLECPSGKTEDFLTTFVPLTRTDRNNYDIQ